MTPGLRVRSQVCETHVMVIRGSETIDLTCGGKPMVPVDAEVSANVRPAAGFDTGTILGKRYTSAGEDGIEVLVTKAGAGTLADGTEPLTVKDPKPLPSSD